MTTSRHIFKVFIRIVFASTTAFSQTTNSTTQTVMFAVNRPVISALDIPSNSGGVSSFSISSETVALQNQLTQQSIKVTVSVPQNDLIANVIKESEVFVEPNKPASLSAVSQNNVSNAHLDLRSILQMKESKAIFKRHLILTVTE